MDRDEAKRGVNSRNGEPFGADPIDALLDEGPIDIAAVRHDDALIDAIAGNGPIATDSAEEYQLAMLLAAWRAEVESTPMPVDPDLDTVIFAVNQEIAVVSAINRRRKRFVGPTAAAAAVLAVVAGLTAISYNANPGDALWSVKEAVFSKQADSTMARIDSSTDMDAAEVALAQGDVEGAASLLERAANRANGVDDTAHREGLQARAEALRARLDQAGSTEASPLPTTESQIPSISFGPLPPLLLPTGTLLPAPPETNQLAPGTAPSVTAAIPASPGHDLPLLAPTTEPPLTVEPAPTEPPVISVEPEPTDSQPPVESIDPSTVTPPANDTLTPVQPPADLAPAADPSPLTTARAEPDRPSIPSGTPPGGITLTPNEGQPDGIGSLPRGIPSGALELKPSSASLSPLIPGGN